ncbi:hypothetical protein IC762_17690 [Bradyrhizobium genosp. L]|uniref:hypothetical protein n=1 Tax=Bradyrhizobium genosp. L TaxID=83637 RepID=UPI0018A2E0CD|nr:hypothetical protein [Bradyrhizobium genosp. L]QPF81659.1 hypothetical protein IC762_17690 [Bradyrhizobium genosp. L]
MSAQELRFGIRQSVETEVVITATFPTYLTLYDYVDDGTADWHFFVRIDLIGASSARVDFLKIESDGTYEFRSEVRLTSRLGEYFGPHNSYSRISAGEYRSKIAELRGVLDTIPNEE